MHGLPARIICTLAPTRNPISRSRWITPPLMTSPIFPDCPTRKSVSGTKPIESSPSDCVVIDILEPRLAESTPIAVTDAPRGRRETSTGLRIIELRLNLNKKFPAKKEIIAP
jgi:hypothetical protein